MAVLEDSREARLSGTGAERVDTLMRWLNSLPLDAEVRITGDGGETWSGDWSFRARWNRLEPVQRSGSSEGEE